jgi:hypothetical protein
MSDMNPRFASKQYHHFHLSFENALWIGGSIIFIAALLFALLNNWTLLNTSEKYAIALTPLVLSYAGGLLLSALQKLPILKNACYLIFGIVSPFSFVTLGLSLHPDWHAAYLMILPIACMLIPAIFYQEVLTKIFTLIYFIITYLMLMGLIPDEDHIPTWVYMETESIVLGLLLLAAPEAFLPLSWKGLLHSWCCSFGAFFILLGATIGIWGHGAYSFLNAGVSFIIILAVLALGLVLRSKIIFVEVLAFYVMHVLQFGIFFFDKKPTLWPLILGLSGLGWMLLGCVYFVLKKILRRP